MVANTLEGIDSGAEVVNPSLIGWDLTLMVNRPPRTQRTDEDVVAITRAGFAGNIR